MANLITQYASVKKEDERKHRLDDLFIKLKDGTYIKASELYVYINDSKSRKVRSIVDIRSAFNSDKLAKDKKSSEYFGNSKLEKLEIFTKNYELPTTYEKQIDTGAEIGLKQTHKLELSNNYSSNYLYVKVGREWKHLPKNEIGYFEGRDFITLDKSQGMENGVKSLEDLKDKDLSVSTRYGNYAITAVCADSTFELGEVIAKEKLDLENMQKTTLIPVLNKDSNKVEWKEKDGSAEHLEGTISEQVFKKVDDLATGKKKSVLEVRNYTYDAGGPYISVVQEKLGRQVLVALSNLYELDAYGKPDSTKPIIKPDQDIVKINLDNYITERVGVIIKDNGGNIIEQFVTEALTREQAKKRFDTVKYMQHVDTQFDETAEGDKTTYLRLRNGKYVEEKKAIRPICWDYVDNDTYLKDKDKSKYRYLAHTTGGDFIVDEATYKSGRVNGFIIERDKSSVVVKSKKSIDTCDVIQTENTASSINKCVVIKDLEEERKKEIVKTCCDDFLKAYKANNYSLDEVLVNGEYQELDDQAKKFNRYQITDVAEREYYAGNTDDYKYLENSPLSYDKGKLNGGPKYNTKRRIKDFLKDWLKGAGFAAAFTFSIGGIIAGLVSPYILAALVGGTLLAAPIGVAVLAISGARKNHKLQAGLNPKKSSTKLQKDSIEREINDELTNIIEQTDELMAENEKKINVEQQKVKSKQAKYKKISEKLDSMTAELTRNREAQVESDRTYAECDKEVQSLILEINNLEEPFNESLRSLKEAGEESEIAFKDQEHKYDLYIEKFNLTLEADKEVEEALERYNKLNEEFKKIDNERMTKFNESCADHLTDEDRKVILKQLGELQAELDKREPVLIEARQARDDAYKKQKNARKNEKTAETKYNNAKAKHDELCLKYKITVANHEELKQQIDEKKYKKEELIQKRDNANKTKEDLLNREQTLENNIALNHSDREMLEMDIISVYSQKSKVVADVQATQIPMIDRIDEVAQKLIDMSTIDHKAEFIVKDGKAQVNDSNTALCQDYKKKIRELNDNIKTLKKDLKKAKSETEQKFIQDKLDVAENELKEMQNTYHATSVLDHEGEEYRRQVKNVKTVKAFLQLKYYGTDDEKKLLKDFKYDPKTREFTYTGKLTATKRKEKKAELNTKLENTKKLVQEKMAEKRTVNVNGKDVVIVIGDIKTETNAENVKKDKVTEIIKENMPIIEVKAEGKTPDVTTTPEPVKEEIKEKTADVKVEKSAETSTRKKQDKLTNLITLKTNGKITYKCTLDVINENQVRITVKGAKKSGDKREIKVDEVVNLDNKNTYYDQICEWIKKYSWGSGVETKKIQEAVKAFIIKHGSEFNKEDVAEL